MADYLNIAGRVRTTASDGVAMEAQEVKDLNLNKSQQEINADVQTELGDRYTKEETYSKEQLNELITTPDVNYVSVVATDATTAVTDILPATGEANTIYRVGNWDGTQYDLTMYALYAWNGSAYVCIAVRSFVEEVYDVSVNHPDGQGNPTPYADLTAALGTNGANIPADIRRGGMSIKFIQGTVQSSDNKYVRYNLLAQSFTTDVEQWAIDDAGVYVDNHEFVEVHIDKDGKILWAIEKNGNIKFGAGVPQQVIDYVTSKIQELSLDEYDDIVTFLGNLIEGDTLATLLNAKANVSALNNKVDKATGKSLINAEYADGVNYTENPEFIKVVTDNDGRILVAIENDGNVMFGAGVPPQVVEYLNNVFAFLNGLEDGENNLQQLLDEKLNSGGIIIEGLDNPEFLGVVLDSQNRILKGIRKNGDVMFGYGVPSEIQNSITSALNEAKAYTDERVPPPSSIDIVVPTVINTIVGDTVQLFYHSIFKCVDFKSYEIKVECNVGNAYPRYYQYTPSEAGINTIDFKIINDNGVILGHKISSIVATNPSQPASSKNVLILGASTEENGEWASELKRRITGNGTEFLSLGYDNIHFVGRKSVTSGGTQVNLEATGGYAYGTYLSTTSTSYRFNITSSPISRVSIGDVYSNDKGTFEVTEINLSEGVGNISCKAIGTITGTVWGAGSLTKVSGTGDSTITYSSSSGSGNPFAYNGVVDIQQYADDYCEGQIDVVVFGELFANSIGSARTSVISLARAFISAFPNIHIYIQMPNLVDIRGGLGVNYGAKGWALGKYLDYQIFDFCDELEQLFENAGITQNVYFVDTLNEVDAVNSFQQTNKKVNLRSTVTEVFGVNGAHPSIVGYNLIADAVFRTLVGNNF